MSKEKEMKETGKKGDEKHEPVLTKKPIGEEDKFQCYVIDRTPNYYEDGRDPKELTTDEVTSLKGAPVIKALFIRAERESDKKRAPRADGKPYPKWFVLSHSVTKTRFERLQGRNESRDQTKHALEGWAKAPATARPLTEILIELQLDE